MFAEPSQPTNQSPCSLRSGTQTSFPPVRDRLMSGTGFSTSTEKVDISSASPGLHHHNHHQTEGQEGDVLSDSEDIHTRASVSSLLNFSNWKKKQQHCKWHLLTSNLCHGFNWLNKQSPAPKLTLLVQCYSFGHVFATEPQEDNSITILQ